MYYTGARTLFYEPLRYCAPKDYCFATIRNRIVAENTWRQVEKTNPDEPFSPDYASGFKCGYSDYLCYGGTGEPPPLPPRKYWRKYHQTPEGHQGILDWFAGFRHGAALAQASGQRELVTVPTSLFTPAGPPPFVPGEITVPTLHPAAPPEVLPTPPATDLPQAPVPSNSQRTAGAEPELKRLRDIPPQYEALRLEASSPGQPVGHQAGFGNSPEIGAQPPNLGSYFGVAQSTEPDLKHYTVEPLPLP